VIPVIDLFAGPGGLGEGFASRTDKDGKRLFRIALSIEMSESARTTLRLRSFFRQFAKSDVPEEYYRFVRGEIAIEELYSQYPHEAQASDEEAWQAELGKTSPEEVDRRIPFSLSPVDQAAQSLKDSWKTVDLVQDHEPIFVIRKVEFWVRKLGTI
jgi:DNA (cytosine-5)-methyltransferase 1